MENLHDIKVTEIPIHREALDHDTFIDDLIPRTIGKTAVEPLVEQEQHEPRDA